VSDSLRRETTVHALTSQTVSVEENESDARSRSPVSSLGESGAPREERGERERASNPRKKRRFSL
jgi:hypothetical protein